MEKKICCYSCNCPDCEKCEGKMDRCINKAISYVEDLIDLYDSNTEITDIVLCHIIEILKGRE